MQKKNNLYRWLWKVNLLVCETGFPEPDMVTVVKPDVVEAGAWLTVRGTETPGGGWSGSTEERSFRGTEVDPAELLSELVPSLSFVDGTVGWGTWCFCWQYTFLIIQWKQPPWRQTKVAAVENWQLWRGRGVIWHLFYSGVQLLFLQKLAHFSLLVPNTIKIYQ